MLIDVIYFGQTENLNLKDTNKFFESYKKYQSGIEHTLIIASKIWEERSEEEYTTFDRHIRDLGAKTIDLSNNKYEFGVYYQIAKESKADYIVFLVSTSEICSENWLLKLTKHFTLNPNLKYVTTSVSYSPTPILPYLDEAIIRKKHHVATIKSTFLHSLSNTVAVIKNIATINPSYQAPHPFIRTNVFAIERLLYLDIIRTNNLSQKKISSYHFENGRQNLIKFILDRNFEYGIIGSDGHCYKENDWLKNQIAANFDTSNILIKDREDDLLGGCINFTAKFCLPCKKYRANYSNPIRFSVLLPTKDRLELLKHAVKSILDQTYSHFELIISDNFSKEDIKSYVEGLNDSRIIYTRTEQPITVSANWNNAQNLASGDYFIMLGDDDALLPSFLEECKVYLEKYQYPDLINFDACLYLQPNVLANFPNGYSRFNYLAQSYVYISSHAYPFFLDNKTRKDMVALNLNFDWKFLFNMQFFLYSKNLAYKLIERGHVYEAPYPDFYSANVMMLLAEKVLVIPKTLIIMGVTSKSYAYYHLNNKSKEGMAFHNEANFREYAHNSVKKKLCNVGEMETAALATFALIPQRFPEYNLKFDFSKYYKAVLRSIIKNYNGKNAWKILLKEFFIKVSVFDWPMYFKYFRIGMKRKIATDEVMLYKPYKNISLLIKDIVSGIKK